MKCPIYQYFLSITCLKTSFASSTFEEVFATTAFCNVTKGMFHPLG